MYRGTLNSICPRISLSNTIDLQWLEQRWPVFHGYFEFVPVNLETYLIAAAIIIFGIFGIILGDFLFYIDSGMLFILIRIALNTQPIFM